MSEEIQSWEVPDIGEIATTVITEVRMNQNVSIDVPAWAKSLLAVSCQLVNVTPTAAESIICSLDLRTLKGISPYTVLFPPLNAILGGVGDQSGGTDDALCVYPINLRLNGGEKLDAYIRALQSSTGVIDGQIGLLFSSLPPAGKQLHAAIGTDTATTTVVGEAAGTAYTVANCARIKELFGILASGTIAPVNPIIGYFRFLSSGFAYVPCKLEAKAVPAVLLTTGQPVIMLSRRKVNLPTKSICVIQDYFALRKAMTNAGRFVTGILYEELN